MADRAQVPVAHGLGDGVPRVLDRPGVVGVLGERGPADGRGEPDVLVGDDEARPGHGDGELPQAPGGRLLVDAGHEDEQLPVLVPPEPVADTAEPSPSSRLRSSGGCPHRHPGEPLGDLAPHARPEPCLQGRHLGDADHGEDTAAPGRGRAAELAVEFVHEVRPRVEAGARIARQVLHRDRDAVQLGRYPRRELARVGGLRQAVVGALRQQIGDGTGGVGPGRRDHEQRKRLPRRVGADLAYDVEALAPPVRTVVEGHDRVRWRLPDLALYVAGDGVGDVVPGESQGPGEQFTARPR
ncbi:hypothetical protein [Streptomyces sp. NPDC055243]|uniref:hypothetical protein n=1 Tax=Streptomyces sp. NPDC055243 TaxID=3365720 RepID=UPI0037D640C2